MILKRIVHYNGYMTLTVTASEARNDFFSILKQIETPGVSVVITYEGHPKGVLMSVDEFEGWLETLDIMSNPEEEAAIEEGMREKERGEVVTLEEFKRKLGADENLPRRHSQARSKRGAKIAKKRSKTHR